MRFVYKINSAYDGFQPNKLPKRMQGRSLLLGWKRYVDSVDVGDEVLVYFLGPHRFVDGVYVRGVAQEVDFEARTVLLRVVRLSTDKPLSLWPTSTELAALVSTRYQQVFVLPDEVGTAPECTLTGDAGSCQQRLCGSCRTWKQLPIIDRANLLIPHRLTGRVDAYAPGLWSIPARSYLYQRGRTIKPAIFRSTTMFRRFKTGEEALAFPLALAAHTALARAKQLDFDAIVPVPLSPDKRAAGEFHRTLALAKELGRLLTIPVKPWLTLDKPISKKRLRTQRGLSAAAFESAYSGCLRVSSGVTGTSILLVDDVCTEGSTLRVCAEALGGSGRAIVACTAAQMAVKSVLRHPEALWAS